MLAYLIVNPLLNSESWDPRGPCSKKGVATDAEGACFEPAGRPSFVGDNSPPDTESSPSLETALPLSSWTSVMSSSIL